MGYRGWCVPDGEGVRSCVGAPLNCRAVQPSGDCCDLSVVPGVSRASDSIVRPPSSHGSTACQCISRPVPSSAHIHQLSPEFRRAYAVTVTT